MNRKETSNKLDATEKSGIIGGMRDTQVKRRRRKGYGCLIFKGENKPYLAKWYVDGQPVYQTTGETDIRRAEDKLDEFTHHNRHQASIEDTMDAYEKALEKLRAKLAKPEIAITEIWTTYNAMMQWGKTKAQSIENYERMTHKLEKWMQRQGCRYVSDVTNEKAFDFLKHLERTLGIDGYNGHLAQYKRVWDKLIEKNEYHILTDTWKGRDKLDKENSSREPFTPDEIKAILANADSDMRMLTLVGLYTGMRLGDSAKFSWDKIDMQNKRMRVKAAKNGKWVRINIPEKLFEALVEAHKTATGEYVNEANAKSKQTALSTRFGRILDKCGIKRNTVDDKGKRKSLKCFHSLRHSTATYLYAAGMSEADIARVLGDDEAMMETYINVDFGDALKDVA